MIRTTPTTPAPSSGALSTLRRAAAPAMGVSIVLCLAVAASVLLSGCTVGPTASQNAGGQKTANSPLDTTTMTVTPDGTNTFVATARGPVTEALVDDEGIESRSTGVVPRRVIWTRDGQRLSIDSGSDINAKGVVIDPATGRVEVAEFSTSSSEPLRALNEALDRYQAVWAKLSEEQRAAVEAQFKAIETIAPPLLDAIRTVLSGGL